MADTWDIVDVQPVAADAVEPPEVVSQPSLESFLAEHGLSKHAAGIVEATGAESVADLKLLDASQIEQVVATAGLKMVAAEKWRRAVAAVCGVAAPAARRGRPRGRRARRRRRGR